MVTYTNRKRGEGNGYIHEEGNEVRHTWEQAQGNVMDLQLGLNKGCD